MRISGVDIFVNFLANLASCLLVLLMSGNIMALGRSDVAQDLITLETHYFFTLHRNQGSLIMIIKDDIHFKISWRSRIVHQFIKNHNQKLLFYMSDGKWIAFFIMVAETPWILITCVFLELRFLKTLWQIWHRTLWFCWWEERKWRMAEAMWARVLLHFKHRTFPPSMGTKAACSWASRGTSSSTSSAYPRQYEHCFKSFRTFRDSGACIMDSF